MSNPVTLEDIYAIEVKSRLTQDSIRQVLRSLEQFKTAFPHYASYQLYGAVGAQLKAGNVGWDRIPNPGARSQENTGF
ncbi:MAG: hypothetical protein AAGE59_02335 [Cyanobacteria bacterium P01_F01_bin.86]